MHSGFATPQATADFAARFPQHQANSFYRTAQSLAISSLGIGSYLGDLEAETDTAYARALTSAINGGINFIDTSLNYRNQRSEIAFGAGLQALIDTKAIRREEFVVCTKAGYLVPDAVPSNMVREEIVGNMHSMNPAFLEDQLERSRRNLNLETIDVFYLHNPETQLQFVSADKFLERSAYAFEKLEKLVAEGKIRYYGTATWNGYRQPDGLSLTKLAALASHIAGEQHHFRFIQLPFNLAMLEGLTQHGVEIDGQRFSVLEAAKQLGITAIASASLLQSKLAQGLPEQLKGAMQGTTSDAGRSIQFARSAPGISSALVGMSSVEHVKENLQVAKFPPLSAEQFERLFAK